MAIHALNRVIKRLRQVAVRQDGQGRADSELLDSFIKGADAEAFEALVRRHGPMVLGVCRRILRNEADAEDAFQATFLVLVRKAGSIRPGGMVSNWLYGVARNTALKAKDMIHKRRAKEKQALSACQDLPGPELAADLWRQLQALLDDALAQLPDKYRVPIVLCELEGKTIKEAAHHLGWPQGTVATRLTKGRSLLAKRLSNHGLALSAAALSGMLSQASVSALVSTPLVGITVKAARVFAVAGRTVPGTISAHVAALTEGVLKIMFISKLKVVAALVSVVAAATLGVGGYMVRDANAGEQPRQTARHNNNDMPKAASQRQPGGSNATKWVRSQEDEERARQIEARSWALRNRRLDLGGRGPYEADYIGGLVRNGAWHEGLPLAPVQASAITKLDDLLRDAFDHSCLAAADYIDTNPPDYLEYLARLDSRMNETIHHGERMVALGLLTEPQAAYMMHRYLTGSQPYHVLSHRKMRELLGMTVNQKKELVKVGEEATSRELRLNLFTVDPDEQEFVAKQMAANAKWMREASLNILTPSQLKKWSQLTAKRSLPATPPEFSTPSKAEAASIKVKEFSPVFRVLAEKEDAFALTDPQKKMLHTLEEITRDGLFWINLRNDRDAAPTAENRVTQARAEFVKHVEQVALFGILTERQAEQVRAARK